LPNAGPVHHINRPPGGLSLDGRPSAAGRLAKKQLNQPANKQSFTITATPDGSMERLMEREFMNSESVVVN
jgi:hypothetical protein